MRSVHVCKPSVSNLLAPRRLLTPRIAVMLNDHSLYEHILEDDIFFGVVGMLECVHWCGVGGACVEIGRGRDLVEGRARARGERKRAMGGGGARCGLGWP